MKYQKTKIPGLVIATIEPKKDERGFFARIFDKAELIKKKISFDVVQTNLSLTRDKGTIRGLHHQNKPFEEAKIVQCIHGKIFDVVVDLRRNSRAFGIWVNVELSSNNKIMIIPKGCAHGFQTLTDDCEVIYYMSEYYSAKHADGIRWNDPKLKINWPLPLTHISERDMNWPFLK